MFALVDCNSFFASCERLFRPDLQNRPVVVLSNNDGCIVARSDEAKALGIAMGSPYFKVRKELEKNRVAVFSSNFPLYSDISGRVMELLSRMTPQIEVYSIDEAFIDLSGVSAEQLEPFARRVREEILRSAGIPTCVGVAPTKVLAKAANHVAKRYKSRTGGVWILDTPAKIEKMLSWLKVEEIWGIGRRSAEKLKRRGVVRADQFAAMPTSEVRALLTIGGERVQKELQGVSCLPFESDSEPRQSICTSRSFGEMVSDLSELESAVAFYATACARKLRSEGGAAGALTLFLRTNRYKFDEPQYHVEERVHFEVATQLDQEIVATALQLLRKLYKPGFLYKKAGVILTEITPLGGEQTNLFDSVDRQKQAASTKAFDQIVDRYGTGAIRRATEERGVHWRPRNAFTSPRYTTEWDEIPLFKI